MAKTKTLTTNTTVTETVCHTFKHQRHVQDSVAVLLSLHSQAFLFWGSIHEGRVKRERGYLRDLKQGWWVKAFRFGSNYCKCATQLCYAHMAEADHHHNYTTLLTIVNITMNCQIWEIGNFVKQVIFYEEQ